VPPGLAVNADRDKLSQVLINLLDKAAKYGREDGSVKVSASEADGAVKVSVENNSPGIPARHLPHSFERFCYLYLPRLLSRVAAAFLSYGREINPHAPGTVSLGGGAELCCKLGIRNQRPLRLL
jgi:light-regulated signal transduction histidine kinase (bacteriophytochrome)